MVRVLSLTGIEGAQGAIVPIRFLHSGKLGDVIYSLPAIRACRLGTLYLQEDSALGLSREQVRDLIPLLKAQEYIADAKVHEGEPIDYDLNRFRDYSPASTNLADCHLKVLHLSPAWRDERWLCAPLRRGESRVVFARSLAHRGVSGFWEICYKRFWDRAIFIGTPLEHREFQREVGAIEYLSVKNLLDMASVIAASELFVGNQSCPYAIAEGLKHPAIQEVCVGVPNCLFARRDSLLVRTEDDLARLSAFQPRA